MFVKICGITREEDARLAADCGASAIGLVFWPQSPRYVDPVRARSIVATLPPFVTPVGVFVNETVERINTIAESVGLGAVQLHGDEQPSDVPAIHRPVVKALGRHGAAEAARWPERVRLLVDADDRIRRGGTGVIADWVSAAALAATRPILLAGGINPANVADAVRAVRPFGIDVSSGVEEAPGIKHAGRVRELFAALEGVARG